MEQIRYQYDKQYGTSATPYGPAYKGVEATQAGETKRTGMTQTGETERQNIVTGEGKRQFDLINPPEYLAARTKEAINKIKRPERAEEYSRNVEFPEAARDTISTVAPVLKKHMIATQTLGGAGTPGVLERLTGGWLGGSFRKKWASESLGAKGVSEKDILPPEKLAEETNKLMNIGRLKRKQDFIYQD
jgi:hypothetical protein